MCKKIGISSINVYNSRFSVETSIAIKKLDEQGTHGKEAFKQNDLTLCIRKYFYI
jgi:hypothetical protein